MALIKMNKLKTTQQKIFLNLCQFILLQIIPAMAYYRANKTTIDAFNSEKIVRVN